MTEPKFTPAPWVVKGKEFIHDNNHREIVYVLGYGTMGGLTDSEFEANANLIASAPDLYNILQIMADKDFEFSEYECLLARTALAKARGES